MVDVEVGEVFGFGGLGVVGCVECVGERFG